MVWYWLQDQRVVVKQQHLYGALSELNQSTKKIITAEDPVEYRLPRINQVQVNSKIDLTFLVSIKNRTSPRSGYHDGW